MSGADAEVFTGLDELLQAGSDDDTGTTPQRAERGPAGWAWRAGLAAALVGAAVWWILRRLGFVVAYPLPALTVFVILALRRALRAVAAAPVGLVTVPDGPAGACDEPVDGLALAIRRWRNRLMWTERDRDHFASAVVPRLRELVEDRLWLRHGGRLADDPDRARRLLGGTLWTMLHEPGVRTPTPRDLAAAVAHLEEV